MREAVPSAISVLDAKDQQAYGGGKDRGDEVEIWFQSENDTWNEEGSSVLWDPTEKETPQHYEALTEYMKLPKGTMEILLTCFLDNTYTFPEGVQPVQRNVELWEFPSSYDVYRGADLHAQFTSKMTFFAQPSHWNLYVPSWRPDYRPALCYFGFKITWDDDKAEQQEYEQVFTFTTNESLAAPQSVGSSSSSSKITGPKREDEKHNDEYERNRQSRDKNTKPILGSEFKMDELYKLIQQYEQDPCEEATRKGVDCFIRGFSSAFDIPAALQDPEYKTVQCAQYCRKHAEQWLNRYIREALPYVSTIVDIKDQKVNINIDRVEIHMEGETKFGTWIPNFATKRHADLVMEYMKRPKGKIEIQMLFSLPTNYEFPPGVKRVEMIDHMWELPTPFARYSATDLHLGFVMRRGYSVFFADPSRWRVYIRIPYEGYRCRYGLMIEWDDEKLVMNM
jgi:hypothetical protein